MLVNEPPKWTLNGVISVGVFTTHATLNGVKKHNLTLNGVFIKTLYRTLNVVVTGFILYK